LRISPNEHVDCPIAEEQESTVRASDAVVSMVAPTGRQSDGGALTFRTALRDKP